MENFKALGVHANIVKGLTELGIIEPTEIQKRVIPLIAKKNADIIGQAQTGTGKTAAYGIPLLQRINPEIKEIQALILCPTRELSKQVAKQLFRFTKYTEKIFTESVYGGEQIDIQIKALSRPTHVVVATPGRLIDLVKREVIDLSSVKTVVLDEADEMLSMGFKNELDQILGYLSSIKNKWLFSATMPKGIQEIVNQHLSEKAHRIDLSKNQVTNSNIKHQYISCDDTDKLLFLLQKLEEVGDSQAVVFCKTKAVTHKLASQLKSKNIEAAAISGNINQKDRDKVMRAFRKDRVQVLVATDLAARGIDIKDLNYVFHYQLPESEEYYTHRSGRTARAGNSGISLVIANGSEQKRLTQFEKVLNIKFEKIIL